MENINLEDIYETPQIDQVIELYNLNEPKVYTTLASSSEINELKTLLTNWKLEKLLDHLIARNISVESLKIIKTKHVEKLLQEFDLGTQILFEDQLEKWRQSLDLPLVDFVENNIVQNSSFYNVLNSSPSLTITRPSSASSIISSENSGTNGSFNVNLSGILNEYPKGILLCEYYQKIKMFDEEQRNSLINLIGQYFDSKGINLSIRHSYDLENQILERFPTEKLEYYRTSKRGRIYNKVVNLKASSKTILGAIKRGATDENCAGAKKSRYEKDFDPEADANECLRALKFDNLNSEEFDNCWKACSKLRLSEIKKLQSTDKTLEKWPFYKKPFGFRLIDMDYSAAFPNSDGLLQNWECFSKKIENFLNEGNHLKEKSIRGVLQLLKSEENLLQNGRDATLFWAMHGYFVPTTKIVEKDAISNKNKVKKFTIRDSQDSFLVLGKNYQDIEDYVGHLRKRNKPIQPFIYCIGQNFWNINEIFVYFDNTRYEFKSFIRAVDICFKIFYLFDLKFPCESIMFYSFLEMFFYKLKSKNCFSKCHIMAEYINRAD